MLSFVEHYARARVYWTLAELWSSCNRYELRTHAGVMACMAS